MIMTKVWVKGKVSTEGFAQWSEYIFQIKVQYYDQVIINIILWENNTRS